MMKKECEFWLVCGPGAVYHNHAKHLFSYNDPRRNYRDNFCFSDFKKCDHFLLRKEEFLSQLNKGGDEELKIVEILEGSWFRLKWFFKDDIIKVLSWTGIYILGGAVIAYFALKEFYERRKKKGGEI